MVKAVVGARTAAALLGLNGARKRRVAKFLYELGFIKRDEAPNNMGCIDLWSADFNGADLEEAILPQVCLKDVYLREAKLKDANLNDADLRNTDLRKADLSDADLSRADLSDALLADSRLGGTNLSGANLRRAEGLTQEQIQPAIGDQEIQLPNGLRRPESWSLEQVP